MSRVELWDTTCREGEQQRGVHFSLDEKIKIASMLFDYGLADTFEVHCYEGESCKEAGELVKQFGDNKIISHHRSLKSDIDVSQQYGKNIAMFLTVSDIQLPTINLDRETALERMRNDITYARDKGSTVKKYALEDPTRQDDLNFLKKAAKTAEEAGAETLSIPDTVGAAFPQEYANLCKYIMETVNTPIVTHCHNDLGLASANTLAAHDVGVRKFGVSVMGLGSRAGIAATEQVVIGLRRKGEDINTENLKEVCDLVSRYSGVKPKPHDPLIGENAFAVKVGTHANKIEENPAAYELFPPEEIGRKRKIILSGFSGKGSIRMKLEEYGVSGVPQNKLIDIRDKVVKLGFKYRSDVSDYGFELIASEVLGMKTEDLIRLKKDSAPVTAIVSIDAGKGQIPDIARKIRREIAEVGQIYEIIGRHDLIAIIKTNNPKLVDHCIDKMRYVEGVEKTETVFATRTWKE